MSIINDFVITVATANGSGSQSSNNILVRTLFRMGIPVGGKNLFPSNIQGLPTWFTIRANEQGFTSRKELADVVIAMNPATGLEDQKLLRSGGVFLLSDDVRISEDALRSDIVVVRVPFKKIVGPVTDSPKLRKLLVNMTYVGLLAELLEIPQSTLEEVIMHQFGDKKSVIESNLKAIQAGRDYANQSLGSLKFEFRAVARDKQNEDRILIDGNTAAAAGFVFGGCTFVAWYPITPSSSLVESFIDLAEQYRVEKDGKRNFAVVQAEDELASIAMVTGAGWAGARAMTATSGPGLSLMAETAGLAYFAEVPAVIWDVQRVGPSTGLPTRTMQGDLLSAYYLSHGDTRHVVLLPGTVAECFEFGQVALDLAERLQTLVIVLSDLDLGMNLHGSDRFVYPEKPMDRGKVLDDADLSKVSEFKRYKDVDGDGITYRTLTGARDPKAGYFTRGTGHNEAGQYSEKGDDFAAKLNRLTKKMETAATLVPQPVVDAQPGVKVGLLVYGSSAESACELRYLLKQKGVEANCMRLRALPLSTEVESYLDCHDRVYVIEQNRDGQLMTILRAEMPQYWSKCHSIRRFDGMPMDPQKLCDQIISEECPRA